MAGCVEARRTGWKWRRGRKVEVGSGRAVMPLCLPKAPVPRRQRRREEGTIDSQCDVVNGVFDEFDKGRR